MAKSAMTRERMREAYQGADLLWAYGFITSAQRKKIGRDLGSREVVDE